MLPKTHPHQIAHDRSRRHRAEVEASKQCGCFYCLDWFEPGDIREWIDEGRTALCPCCGIDSVLPEDQSYTPDFMKEMQNYWFGDD